MLHNACLIISCVSPSEDRKKGLRVTRVPKKKWLITFQKALHPSPIHQYSNWVQTVNVPGGEATEGQMGGTWKGCCNKQHMNVAGEWVELTLSPGDKDPTCDLSVLRFPLL